MLTTAGGRRSDDPHAGRVNRGLLALHHARGDGRATRLPRPAQNERPPQARAGTGGAVALGAMTTIDETIAIDTPAAVLAADL